MSKTESGLRGQAWRASLLIYSSVQFLLLAAIAMLVYPGGAVYELAAGRYLFFRNFFSDLGATSTPSGRPNLASHILFVIALGTVGIALILASSNWRVIAARRRIAQAAGWASQAFEIIAGLGFIGIAVTPWNLVLDAHNGFVRAAFSFLLAYGLSLLIPAASQWLAYRLHGDKCRLSFAPPGLRRYPVLRSRIEYAEWP